MTNLLFSRVDNAWDASSPLGRTSAWRGIAPPHVVRPPRDVARPHASSSSFSSASSSSSPSIASRDDVVIRTLTMTLILVIVLNLLESFPTPSYALPSCANLTFFPGPYSSSSCTMPTYVGGSPTTADYCSLPSPTVSLSPTTASPTTPTPAPTTGLLTMIPNVCNATYETPYLGRCYIFSYNSKFPILDTQRKSVFADAQTICNSYGASLGSIFTQDELCWTYNSIDAGTDTPGCKNHGDQNFACWLGLSQAGGGGLTYNWQGSLFGAKSPDLSGQVAKFVYDQVPFAQGGFSPWKGSCTFDIYSGVITANGGCEPNNVAQGNGGQDCIRQLQGGNAAKWGDGSCVSTLPFFCTRLANCPQGYWRSGIYQGYPQRWDRTMKPLWRVDGDWSPGLCTQCAGGKYHPQTWDAQMASRECFNCAAGYCGYPGATNSSCSKLCDAGYYCPLGTSCDAQVACGPGYYNPVRGATNVSACLDTPAGYWSSYHDGNATTDTMAKCDAGRCGYPNAQSSACQDICPAGYYCPAGTACPNTTIAVPNLPIPCGSPDKYAPAGQGSCLSVGPGYYSEGGTPATRSNVVSCPAGSYCPGDGYSYECPSGTYSSALGTGTLSSCLPCTRGFYCPPGSTTPTAQYCGEDTSIILPYPPPMYYCPAGTTSRLLVGEGNYSTPTSAPANQRYDQAVCTGDLICVNGTARHRIAWGDATSCADLLVNENSVTANATGRILNATLDSSLKDDGYVLRYSLLSFSSLACPSPMPNDGIFSVDPVTGAVLLTRLSYPTWLDYEACTESNAYTLSVQANATLGAIQAILTCDIRVLVQNQNDQPLWPPERDGTLATYNVAYRAIPEREPVNTVADLCSAQANAMGCPTLNDLNNPLQNYWLEATDEDVGSVLRYTIVSGEYDDTPDNPFRINACSGVVTLKSTNAISFYSVPNRTDPFYPSKFGRYYRFTVRVTDDGVGGQFEPLSADFPLIIYITSKPNPPAFPADTSSLYFSVNENRPQGQVIGSVTANDVDLPPQILYYRILPTLDYQYFTLAPPTPNPTWVFGQPPYQIVTTKLGSDSIDYESTKQVYQIQIEVRDCLSLSCPASLGGTDTVTISINVNNTNDPCTFDEIQPLYIVENAVPGASVCLDSSGSTCNFSPSPSDRVQIVDADAGYNGDTDVFSLVDDAFGTFSIDPSNGQIYVVSNARLDFENASLADALYTGRKLSVTVQCTSTGWIPGDSQTRNQTYDIFLTNVNEPPAFMLPVPSYFVLETTPLSSTLDTTSTSGAAIHAADPDNQVVYLKGVLAPQQSLTFSRSPTLDPARNDSLPGGAFVFGARTDPTLAGAGEIQLAQPVNYESLSGLVGAPCIGTDRCYIVGVRVTDNGNPSQFDETTVYVKVVDVNDPPAFTQTTLTVNVPESYSSGAPFWNNGSYQVAGPIALIADEDNVNFHYWLDGGTGTSLFSITDAGAGFTIHKMAGASFKYATAGLDQFTLIVMATDNGTSSKVGSSCSLTAQGSCGTGAFCALNPNGLPRCYELCYDTNNGTLAANVPHTLNEYFCDYGSSTPLTRYAQTVPTPLTVTIRIQDDNDPPYIIDDDKNPFNAGCTLSGTVAVQKQSEVQVALGALSVMDPDVTYAAAPFTFTAVNSSDDIWATFNLSATTGSVSILNPYPATTLTNGTVYQGMIRVSDQWPPPAGTPLTPAAPGTSTCLVKITVVNFNNPPVLVAPLAVTVPEYTPLGTVIYAAIAPNFTQVDPDVAGFPPDHLTFDMADNPNFYLNSTTSSLVTAGALLDFEPLVASDFAINLIVRVRDSYNAQSVATVTINVRDVNEAPAFTSSLLTMTVMENAPPGVRLDNDSLNAFIEDPDVYSPVFTNNVVEILNCPNVTVCPFEMSTDNVLQVRPDATLDYNVANSWYLDLKVSDENDPSLYALSTLQVTLIEVNEAPVLLSNPATLYVPEGPGGTDLVDLSSLVMDDDTWDQPIWAKLTWYIIDGNPGVFEVANGKLRVATSATLDYEDVRFYNLTVMVQDSQGATAFGIFLVNVQNVPDVTITSASVVTSPVVNPDGLTLSCDVSSVSTIQFFGTNLGFTASSVPAVPTSSHVVSVSYRRSDSLSAPAPSVSVSPCWIAVPNSLIMCNVTGSSVSVGVNLQFNVTVTVPSVPSYTGLNSAAFSSVIRFESPSITSIVKTGGSSGSAFTTLGGDSFAVSGRCLGRASLDGLIFSATDSSADSYLQTCSTLYTSPAPCTLVASCTPTTANGTGLACVSSSPLGYGSSLNYVVKVAKQSSSSFTGVGFTSPVVTTATLLSAPTNTLIPTTGIIAPYVAEFNGTNFSPFTGKAPTRVYLIYNQSPPLGYREFNALSCTVVVPGKSVRCSAFDSGVGANLPVGIVFGDQSNALQTVPAPPTFSYAAPVFSSMYGQDKDDLSTSGGELIILTGTNFGPSCGIPGTSLTDGTAQNCPYVTATYTCGSLRATPPYDVLVYTCEVCAVLDSNTIVCATVPGTGAGHAWTLSVGNRLANKTHSLTSSYAHPVVASYQGVGATGALTSGYQSISIIGGNFGPVNGANVTARYGNKLYHENEFAGLNCFVYTAHTEVRCLTSEGAGNELSWTVTVDGQVGDFEQTAYHKPTLDSISFPNSSYLNNDGGDVVVVTGTNFGPISPVYLELVTLGPSNYPLAYDMSTRCAITTDHTQITCTTPPGIGSGLKMQVTVRGQASGQSPFTLAYQPPVVQNYTLLDGNARTAGNSRIALRGLGFALCDPNSKVVATWTTAGGGTVPVDISAYYRLTPSRTQVTPPLACPYGPTTELLVELPAMTGVDFYGYFGVKVTSSTLGSSVQTNAQLSTEALIHYDAVRFDALYVQSDVSNPGNVVVSLFGDNFCPSSACCWPVLRNVPVPLANIISHSHTVIVFSATTTGDVYVQCLDGSVTNPLIYTTTSPKVVGTIPRLDSHDFATGGGELLQVWGTDFGELPGPDITIGGKQCNVTDHVSMQCASSTFLSLAPPTAMEFTYEAGAICYQTTCRVPPGTGSGLGLVVTAQGSSSNPTDVRFEFLDYAKPTVNDVVGSGVDTEQPSSGGGELKISGINFGVLNGTVYIGGVNPFNGDFTNALPCDVTSWSDSNITCTVPPGEGRNLRVAVVQATGGAYALADPLITVSYGPPDQVVVLNGLNGYLTQGGELMLLEGVNFGRPYQNPCNTTACSPTGPIITVGSSQCTIVSSDFTHAACLTPPGEGIGQVVTLTVAGQSYAIPLTTFSFDYAPPVISLVYPNANLPTSGYDPDTGAPQYVSISGLNFGVNKLNVYFDATLVAQRSIVLNRPDLSVNTLAFANHTLITFRVPRFFGANCVVTMTVFGQPSSYSGETQTVSYALPTPKTVKIYDSSGTTFTTYNASKGVYYPTTAWDVNSPETLDVIFPPSAGRRRRRASATTTSSDTPRRRLDASTLTTSYGFWTTCVDTERLFCFSGCESNFRARNVFWMTQTDIAPNGDYRRVSRHFDVVTDSASANETLSAVDVVASSTCAIEALVYQVQVDGKFEDAGPSPQLTCGGRLFKNSVDSMKVTLLADSIVEVFQRDCRCGGSLVWAVNVEVTIPPTCDLATGCPKLSPYVYLRPGKDYYGTYIISDDRYLYLTATQDATLTEAGTRTNWKFSDLPIAFTQNALNLDSPRGPTDGEGALARRFVSVRLTIKSGCYQWESVQAYIERATVIANNLGVALNSVPRECQVRATMTIEGSNFGSDELGIPNSLRVFFIDTTTNETFEAATTTAAGSHSEVCPSPTCLHTDDKIVFQIPFGIGKSLAVKIQVGNQYMMANVTFSYLSPTINDVIPGTVQHLKNFQSAQGEPIQIKGSNFGGRDTNATVLINGRQCSGAKWQPNTALDSDGYPYVACDAPNDVVGPKFVMMCLAGQTTLNRLFRSDAPVLLEGEREGVWSNSSVYTLSPYHTQLRSLTISRCTNSTIGRLYELCAECPMGASCVDGSFNGPTSDPNFYGQDIPIYLDDGSLNPLAMQLCSPLQWNSTLTADFADYVQRESCVSFAGCEPPTACAGNNTCGRGYEYAKYKCQNKRGYLNETTALVLSYAEVQNTTNACRVTVDPYTGEYQGVDADCRGGLGSFETCTADHPEQCSRCLVRSEVPVGGGDAVIFGVCQCDLPARCALCTMNEYFRLNNECQPCPENPALLIAGLFLAAIGIFLLGWFLSARKVNLAFVTIGIDYFQVLAVLSTTKVPWPEAIRALLNVLSVFNFNIDIAAPECFSPNLEYEVKWWLTEMIPVALMVVVVLVGAVYTCVKMCRYGAKATFATHVSALISIYIVSFYYLYLALTKRALDVFNCNPVIPDDGYLYTTFTSLECDGGGLCRCNDPGGPQQRLAPIAIAFLIIYSGGFPLYVTYTLRKNAHAVRTDQYLRAYGLGDARSVNPETYDVRKRYSKMYYQFKPRFATMWIIVLLMRKFWIAFAALIFRGSPAFQLAVILLVLFASLVLQVLWRPYMSTGERTDIQMELDALAERAIKEPEFQEYIKIRQVVERCKTLSTKKHRVTMQRKVGNLWNSFSNKSRGQQQRLETIDDEDEDQVRARQSMLRRRKVPARVRAALYFANLNTLEFILLGCGILVCLAGIMFQASSTDTRALVQWQSEVVANILVIIIVTSLSYYVAFFVAEIAPACMTRVLHLIARLTTRKGKAVGDDEEDYAYRDENVELNDNPMFGEVAGRVATMDTRVLESEVAQKSSELEKAEAENKRLRNEIKQKKVDVQMGKTNAMTVSVEEEDKRYQRKEFAQTRLSSHLSGKRSRARAKKVGDDDDDEVGEEEETRGNQ